MNVEEMEVPKSISDAILKFKFDDERLLNYTGLGDILRGYFKLVDKNGVVDYNADNYLVAKAGCIQNQKIKEFYLTDELRLIIQNEWIYRMDKVLSSVKPLFKTEAGKVNFSKFVEDYSKIVAAHAKFVGTAAFPFEFEDRNGKIVKLSDFKGKYLFIDCWATWCAPCKYEIPFIQKLEKDLDGKNIRFVSLSMDKPADKEAWKKYLTEHEMNGVCLITPNAFDHPMVKLYGINSIPRFLLIDKAGKLMSVRARRPHDKVLKLQLLDLVK
jgi:thiol-disulfide isomerase/thioredoxin